MSNQTTKLDRLWQNFVCGVAMLAADWLGAAVIMWAI